MAQLGVVLATFGSAVTAEDVPAYLLIGARRARGPGRPDRGVPPPLRPDRSIPAHRHHRRRRRARSRRLLDAGPGTRRRAWSPGCCTRSRHSPVRSTRSPPTGLRPHRRGGAGAAVLADHPRGLRADRRSVARRPSRRRRAHRRRLAPHAGMDRCARGARPRRHSRSSIRTVRDRIPIIFTAHSLPRPVVDRDPGYITQLRDTATAVATRAGSR